MVAVVLIVTVLWSEERTSGGAKGIAEEKCWTKAPFIGPERKGSG
jgi:hypothetical protein